jgi:hypothetical protein
MKRTFLCLALCVFATTAWAAPWRPVVALATQLGSMVDLNRSYLPEKWQGEGFQTGATVAAGVRHGRHEVYLAYQLMQTPVVASSSHFFVALDQTHIVTGDERVAESVRERRTRIGYRYWPHTERSRFAPMIGAGAGIVESTIRRHFSGSAREEEWTGNEFVPRRVFYDYDDGYSLNSHTGADLLLEGGVACRIGYGVEALALAQVQLYDVDYPLRYIMLSDHFDYGGYNLLPTVGLELRYTWGH